MGFMAFDWLKRSTEARSSAAPRAIAGEESVGELVARRKFSRALSVLRTQFESGNRSPELRLQFAEVLVQIGKSDEAIPVLIGVADELATASRERAIAALRRVDRIDPGREEVVMRLATLGVGGR
jgi:thioredoxin-like negative regulator of GroEL